MPKRKQKDPSSTRLDGADEDSGTDDDLDILNTDFEFFDPQPAVDFHGLKRLLTQLFDVDAALLPLSGLVDLILAQNTIGSTVKTESNETDPWAFLTALNAHQHRGDAAMKALTGYLSARAATIPSLAATLPNLLDGNSGGGAQVGLVLTERFINLPPQLAPPMYRMLLEELGWAVADKEEYNFTHFLIVSKTYTEVESALPSVDGDGYGDGESSLAAARPSKKKHKKLSGGANGTTINTEHSSSDGTFYFHPEDEVLQKHASGWGNFAYSNPGGESDSKRAFHEMGIRPSGHLILIEASRFEGAVKAVEEFVGSGM